MIEINLLPDVQKKELQLREASYFIARSFIIIFAVIIFSSFLLLAINQLMKSNLNSIERQIETYEKYFQSAKNKEIESNINEINKMIRSIAQVQKNRTNWSETLIELSQIVPPEIQFNEIKINKLEKKIEISGKAKTRDQLLKFQDALENSDFFENVTSPISNIVSPENINFNLTASLTNKALAD